MSEEKKNTEQQETQQKIEEMDSEQLDQVAGGKNEVNRKNKIDMPQIKLY